MSTTAHGSSQNEIEFQWIETASLRPNPWNPNRMSESNAAKLEEEIKKGGMILPVVVRPDGSQYQIVDGEHRWKMAGRLKMEKVPCLVVALDEQEARIKTLQLNRLRGEDDPEILARLLRDLSAGLGIDVLSDRLPFDAVEIEQSLELLELMESEESRKRVNNAMRELSRERLFSVIVSEAEKNVIEDALQLIQSRAGSEANPGAALAGICEKYVNDNAGKGI